MASKVVAVSTEADHVLVTVRHLDTDSFSRSVRRAADAAWKSLPYDVRIRTTYTEGRFAHTTFDRTCYSTFAFAPSWDRARAVLPTATA